jgi:hypothetical protein
MKTVGRRMQSKQAVCSARGPMKILEEMNLGARQHLTAWEKRSARCLNARGEILDEVYGDQEGSRTTLLFQDRMVLKARPRKAIMDTGSELNGRKKKCLMKAVLACVAGDANRRMCEYFLKHCANE